MYAKKHQTENHTRLYLLKRELKEAFKSPITYELFKQALISQILVIYYQARENHKYDILEDEENV